MLLRGINSLPSANHRAGLACAHTRRLCAHWTGAARAKTVGRELRGDSANRERPGGISFPQHVWRGQAQWRRSRGTDEQGS